MIAQQFYEDVSSNKAKGTEATKADEKVNELFSFFLIEPVFLAGRSR